MRNPNGNVGINHDDMTRKSTPDGNKSKHKGPEAGVCLMSSPDSWDASMASKGEYHKEAL